MELFTEVSLIVLVATVTAGIMRLFRQPLVVGYIVAGIIVGPYGFNVLHSVEHVELFSKLGITVLLFIVGLNLSPRVISEVGKVSLITGVGQVVFTSIIGFLLTFLLGFSVVSSLYIAIALTFSSTIIILKLLSDRGDLNRLYGKISIGFLLVQDIIATLILLFISAFLDTTGANIGYLSAFIIVKILIISMSLYLLNYYIMPSLLRFIARSQEFLFLFSMAWGLSLASIFAFAGFSAEIGALVAGVMLSVTPFAYEIGSRLKPLRDFFIVVFFILLGSQMAVDQAGSLIIPAIILSLFVLLGNPIIVVILMNLLGFKKRTGFMAGLTVAQISEFSLILATIGFQAGHISEEVLSLITLVGLITIAGSTYFILYADSIYPRVKHLLSFILIKRENRTEPNISDENYSLVLFGFNRVGKEFVSEFKSLKEPFTIVDYNPLSIKRLKELKLPYRFGDAQDIEFLSELPLPKAKMIVSTIPDHATNMLIIKYLKKINPRAISIVISDTVTQARNLYKEGATYVMMPHYLGARVIAQMIRKKKLEKVKYQIEQKLHKKDLALLTYETT